MSPIQFKLIPASEQSQTPAQQICREGMPEDLQESFCFILNEASDAAAKWKLVMQLFGKSEARCTLLSQTGAVFFALTRDALITDALLTLGRLLDKPQQGKNNNLCLEYLLDSIRRRIDKDLASELEAVLKDARRSEAKARKHRNKRIAHNDLQTHLDDAGSPLPNATVGEMNELLESTQVFLNKIDMYFCKSQTLHSSQALNGDADTMIGFLADGMRYREEQVNQRLLSLGQQTVDWETPSDV
jgi:hypothetical protein